jgi:hypothetical protein
MKPHEIHLALPEPSRALSNSSELSPSLFELTASKHKNRFRNGSCNETPTSPDSPPCGTALRHELPEYCLSQSLLGAVPPEEQALRPTMACVFVYIFVILGRQSSGTLPAASIRYYYCYHNYWPLTMLPIDCTSCIAVQGIECGSLWDINQNILADVFKINIQ